MPLLLIAKIVGPIVLIVGLIAGFKMYVASERADERREVTGEYRDAEQQAEIKDLKGALAEAKKRASVTEESNADLSQSLASGLAQRDAYVERMLRRFREGAPQNPGQTGVAGGSELTGDADRVSFVDDVRICETNTARLINAKDWYERQRTLQPEEDKP